MVSCRRRTSKIVEGLVRAEAAKGSTGLEKKEFWRGTAYLLGLACAPASLNWATLRPLHSPARSGSNFGISSQA